MNLECTDPTTINSFEYHRSDGFLMIRVTGNYRCCESVRITEGHAEYLNKRSDGESFRARIITPRGYRLVSAVNDGYQYFRAVYVDDLLLSLEESDNRFRDDGNVVPLPVSRSVRAARATGAPVEEGNRNT